MLSIAFDSTCMVGMNCLHKSNCKFNAQVPQGSCWEINREEISSEF